MAITWSGTLWVATTAYVLSARVVNGGNVYFCITAGTSAGSGGPTGTSSNITDGTAHWQYLGANTGAVVDFVKIAASPAIGFAGQVGFLALAETLAADPAVWIGGLLDYGRLYLAGHFAQLFQIGNHGPITSENVGPISRAYAALMGPFAVDLTPAGRMYMDLVRTTPATMGLVV